MTQAAIFMNNRTQAVRLPADMRFDASVKKVNVRRCGNERILTPVDRAWDSFFLSKDVVSEDFLADRRNPVVSEREAL